jgi:hypothetical protein
MPYANPDRARTYQRDYRRLRRSGDACTTPLPGDFRLQTAQDVIDLLQEQVAAVRAVKNVGTTERARTVGYLAGIALRAIEAGTMAARLEALEAVLKLRERESLT